MPILVADDDIDTVRTQSLLLRKLGFRVIECVAGNEVMPLVEQHRPRVVLLDLAMPDMDGFEIAAELTDNDDLRPQLLVAVTGYGDEEARRRTTEAGFDYHFVKPVAIADLIALVEEVERSTDG